MSRATRFDEYVDDHRATMERWCEAFDMVLTDDGWSWQPFLDDHNKLVDRFNDLVRKWNRLIVSVDGPRDAGRPLAASAAQAAQVIRLNRLGHSLRGIADEMSLSLSTVRTIIGRKHGTDRTSKKRREKIEIDKHERAHWKAQKRTADALPRQIQAVIATGQPLVQEANGLGRGR